MVITGLPEDEPFDGKDSEEEKVSTVFEKMGVKNSVGPYSAKRIGTVAPDKIRPILVVVTSETTRNEVVKCSSALKHAGDLYTKVRVKKDSHPAVRREWKRLFDAAEIERGKPENAACDIQVDMKNRQLLRDSVVIDTWRPSFF